jgi:FkbM family methyltransferase
MRLGVIARRAFDRLPTPVRERARQARTILQPPQRQATDVLAVARGVGLQPGTIIDVGAAHGRWSLEAQRVYPNARYLLVEPLVEYSDHPDSVRDRLNGAIQVEAAATSAPGVIELHVHEDLVGSSLKREHDGAEFDGVSRQVGGIPIDTLVSEHRLPAPYVLKVDVQGAELEVLGGANETLAEAELVFLEVSLFQFYEDGPVLNDVTAYMAGLGFVPYDLVGGLYRPLDGALAQVDVVFARRSGVLRRSHNFATPQQRSQAADLMARR